MGQIEGLDRFIDEHPFFQPMSDESRQLIVGCASNAVFRTGDLIFKEGDAAESFYLLRHGAVALELHVPGRQSLVVETIAEDEVLGWSWLVAPYRYRNDARAIGLVRAIRIDASCLRDKCETDLRLGYEFYHQFLPVIADRLAAAQLQVVDMYGNPDQYQAGAAGGSEQAAGKGGKAKREKTKRGKSKGKKK